MNTEGINTIRQKAQNDYNCSFTKVYIHMGTCGIAAGAMEILTALKNEIKKAKATDYKTSHYTCSQDHDVSVPDYKPDSSSNWQGPRNRQVHNRQLRKVQSQKAYF